MTDTKEQVVVLVGHCGPDEWMLRSAIGRALPEAMIRVAHSDAEFQAALAAGSLCLLNRVLDGAFDDPHGQDLIERTLASGAKAMVVSNFEETHDAAVQAGALRGFGKAAVNEAATAELLQAAIHLP